MLKHGGGEATYAHDVPSMTDRQTDRQTERQTDRQTDRQADRQCKILSQLASGLPLTSFLIKETMIVW